MAHPGGRPTKYTDDMPALFLEAMQAGKTNVQFCASVDICEDTLYEWKKVHEKFSEAFTRGRTKCQAHWEGWLDEQLLNPRANAALIKMKFCNQFGYSDKKEVKQDTTHGLAEPTERKVRKVLDGE